MVGVSGFTVFPRCSLWRRIDYVNVKHIWNTLGGTLYDMIRERGKIDWRQALEFHRTLLIVLCFLKSKSIVHGDIKGVLADSDKVISRCLCETFGS